jgi:putative ABC transport system permease protein
MSTSSDELRYGIRLLFKNPSFTVSAILAMALGIATSTMIFSMINAVLLRPLPYTNPDEVMIVWARFEARSANDIGSRRRRWKISDSRGHCSKVSWR